MTYKDLKSYQQAVIIHDFTVEFCKQYIDKFSRTFDQMVQAARSGKQNIVEGCSVSKTSPQTELKLIGVARGSLTELLEDYKDYLRQRKLEVWGKDDPRTVEIRRLAYKIDRSNRSDKSDRTDRTNGLDRSDRSDTTYTTYQSYMTYLSGPEKAANAMIALINQTNFLLDRQMQAIRKQMGERGVPLITHQQKLARYLADKKKKDEEFNGLLKKIVRDGASGLNKSDKSE